MMIPVHMLGQAPAPPTAQALAFAAVMLGLAVAAGLVLLAWRYHRRLRESDGVLQLQTLATFSPVIDPEREGELLERVRLTLHEWSRNAFDLRCDAAFEGRARGRHVVVVRVSLQRPIVAAAGLVEDDITGRTVVLIDDLSPSPPRFRLTPNHPIHSMIHDTKVFPGMDAFGRSNLVFGPNHAAIRAAMAGAFGHAMCDNHELAIESRAGVLAFLLHDYRRAPADLAAFVDRCAALANLMADNLR